ncbi:hypothetical protein HUW51_14005 [Adhaeribacter swui]|uniref:Uncharacterized protein n=1 Tax=Adhaeribacter swui TaxID=2086471 RepID=A0A7G7G9E5_9BACT|nr:hypothetical protein [Adhaeribacter swui]QNF33779.1 hypothetical protein HUW51_14005 [Adhaeribacter swui]
MNLQTPLLLAVLLLLAVQAFGQKKYEKEYRLKQNKVPAEAKKFVEALSFSGRVKWYREESLNGNTIEAKVTHNQKKHSLEFDTQGNLQDVEVQINWSEIPEETQKNISKNLSAAYTNYKINKIQVQYTGQTSTLLALLKNQETTKEYATKYEIVVKGSKGRQVKLYEITFSQTGEMVATAEIIFRNIDNLAF